MTPTGRSTLQPRRHRWIYAPLLFGFLGSTLGHGSVVTAILLAMHLRGGARTAGGDDGRGGAGDTTVDVSIDQGQSAGVQPALPPIASMAAATATATPEKATPPPPKTPAPKPLLPLPDPKDALKTPPDETPPSAVVSAPVMGGGAEQTRSGKLSGPTQFGVLGAGLGGDTVEGQRALLPHAAACKDPVEGRWESLKYNPVRGTWVHFTLSIRRTSSGSVSGSILSHTWSGGVFDRDPPATCGGDSFDMTVSMNAVGYAETAGRITFGSSRYSIVAEKCFSPFSSYAPDNFSGTIDTLRQEFQSLNNDGANDVNAPYVFRRTSCLGE